MPVLPVDSASVVLVRDAAHGLEVLLVRRDAGSTDFAGASVFPGGLVEPHDHLEPVPEIAPRLARALGLAEGAALAAALHVAGCRELFEEAAILLARRADGDWADGGEAARLRAELSEANFRALLDARGLRAAIDALVPLAHWITPESRPRRWSTRFFLAEAPPGQEPVCDADETCEALWARPDDALAAYRAGEHLLQPPTYRILEELAPFGRTAEALAAARNAGPPRPILPVPLAGAPVTTMLYPGDREYPGGAGRGRNRLVLDGGRWRSERY